jgi:hypothetical protein
MACLIFEIYGESNALRDSKRWTNVFFFFPTYYSYRVFNIMPIHYGNSLFLMNYGLYDGWRKTMNPFPIFPLISSCKTYQYFVT